MAAKTRPEHIGVYREDLEDYYGLLLLGGADEKSAKAKVRTKFNVHGLEVNALGRITKTIPELPERPQTSTAELMGGVPGAAAVANAAAKGAAAANEATEQIWKPAKGMTKAAGGVVVDARGRMLLRAPTNGYGGYAYTWPKGTKDEGEILRETAVREVQEETGIRAKIIGTLGTYRGTTSMTTMYLMRPLEKVGPPDAETERIIWADPDVAVRLIAKTLTKTGRERDIAILMAAVDADDRLHGWLSDVQTALDAKFPDLTEGFKATGQVYVYVTYPDKAPKRWGRYRNSGAALDAAVAAQEDLSTQGSRALLRFIKAATDADADRKARKGDWDDYEIATQDAVDDGVALEGDTLAEAIAVIEAAPPGFSRIVRTLTERHAMPLKTAAALVATLVEHGAHPRLPPQHESPAAYFARRAAIQKHVSGDDRLLALLTEAVDIPTERNVTDSHADYPVQQLAEDLRLDRENGFPLGTHRQGAVNEATLARFIQGQRHRIGESVNGMSVTTLEDAGHGIHKRVRKTAWEPLAETLTVDMLAAITRTDYRLEKEVSNVGQHVDERASTDSRTYRGSATPAT